MKKKDGTKIGLSHGEWRIMDMLWDKNPRTIAELVETFQGITNWDRHVIIMMLKRMEGKKAVSYEVIGRTKHFFPIVEKDQAVLQETEDFLGRVYKGSLGLMLTTMVKQEKISREELDELRSILNDEESGVVD